MLLKSYVLQSVNDHINSKKHGKFKNISEPKQVSLHKAFEASNSQELWTKDFLIDLTKIMTDVDIPLNNVNHSSFKYFIKKYKEQSVPDESTLRKNNVDLVYDEKLALLKKYVA